MPFRLALFAGILALAAFLVHADDTVPAKPSADDQQIIDDTKRLTEAMQESDAEMVVDMTYAPYVNYWGGRSEFIRALQQGFQRTNEANVDIVSCRVIPPFRRISTDRADYAVVLTRTVMTIGDAKIQNDDCVLAIRPKGTAKWQYLGTAKLSNGLRNRLFPDLINVDFPEPQMKRLN
jgi:hypothetical protein